MNTAKLKTFAQEARTLLIEGVKQKILYWGFDKKGNLVNEPMAIQGGMVVNEMVIDDPQLPAKWKSLKEAINHKGIDVVVEEAAYTWFNRMMAIRILAENDYAPAQLAYGDSQSNTPLILQRARRGQYDFLDQTGKTRLPLILHNYEREIDAFAILLLGYCKNNTLINNVFGQVDDFTEILLPNNILTQNGFVHLLNKTDAITEEDYKQVELIGWLYQFYISEKKDEVFAGFKKNKKAEAKDIPAATQIFTPNWIVKYMVENTVGKLWLDLHPDSPIKPNLRYLVESAGSTSDQSPATRYPQPEPIITEVAQLKLLDPACGSGHILVEGFDLLFQMYMEEFYSKEEAVESILQNNLFGLDIDKRAVQLSIFAIMLKAAVHSPDVLSKSILPHVYAMPDPHDFSWDESALFLGDEGTRYQEKLYVSMQLMQQAQNLGSIMKFNWPVGMREFVVERLHQLENKSFRAFDEESLLVHIKPFIEVFAVLTQQYEAVAANPPYMHRKNMNSTLKNYVFKIYAKSNTDLFAVFIEVVNNLTVINGFNGSINQQSWMFISSYSNLREEILNNFFIESLLHLGLHVFKELNTKVVQSTTFILKKTKEKKSSIFYDLRDGKNLLEKERIFISKNKIYQKDQTILLRIPGFPIAYWVPNDRIAIFDEETIDGKSTIFQGMITGDNDLFVRFWYEINNNLVNASRENYIQGDFIEKYWTPYNKGGDSVKWYGNHDYVVNFKNEGRDFTRGKYQFRELFFKEYVTWSYISLSLVSRYFPKGFIWDVSGSGLFPTESKDIYFIQPLLSSKVGNYILRILNPTLNFQVENIASVPLIYPDEKTFEYISVLAQTNIHVTKIFYDQVETAWDFKSQLLISKDKLLKQSYHNWVEKVVIDFFQLHTNEEELNRLFIDIYGLQDELTPEVALKEITILHDELDRNALEAIEPVFREKGKEAIELPIKKDVVLQQFVSYAVGCMMGRYRLDKPGLQIAHPNPTSDEVCTYAYNGSSFEIDDDAIIPLMGNDGSFSDDALNRMKHFLEIIWGPEKLTENMNFLQECLGKDLDVYLTKHFWADHCKTYKKKPIYWLFASEKGAFQVIVYMHRMNRFTVENIRTKYLLPHLRNLQSQISLLEGKGASISREDARKLDKLRNDRIECEEYDLNLKDKAEQQIEFDLDDGVTENYKLFEGVMASVK